MTRPTGRSFYQIVSMMLLLVFLAVSLTGCAEEEPRHNNIPISLWMKRIVQSENVRTVDQAIEAIISIGEPAVPYLIKTWKKNESIEIRCRIATILEGIGPAAAPSVPELVKALNAIEEQMVSCAAFALGGIGPAAAPAAEKLGSLLRSSDSTTQINILYALGAIGPQAAGQMDLVLEAVERERTRDVAIDALSQLGPKAIEAVQPWLDNGSREQKLGALQVLANSTEDVALGTILPKLAALTKDDDVMVRGAAARAIGRARSEAASVQGDLLNLLNDKDPDVRRDAIQALVNIGPDAGADGLIAALGDPRPKVREGAARVIGRYQTLVQQSRDKLIQHMADGNVDVRVAAIDALTSLGADVVPVMIRQLKSSSVLMRFGAARVLGNLGSESRAALPELQKLMNHNDKLLSNEAKSAIAKIR
ncbi:HEAT repeat domain-containing protein [bacterium]|nr:HEAT repeat domain-containing protein [bacterium]